MNLIVLRRLKPTACVAIVATTLSLTTRNRRAAWRRPQAAQQWPGGGDLGGLGASGSGTEVRGGGGGLPHQRGLRGQHASGRVVSRAGHQALRRFAVGAIELHEYHLLLLLTLAGLMVVGVVLPVLKRRRARWRSALML